MHGTFNMICCWGFGEDGIYEIGDWWWETLWFLDGDRDGNDNGIGGKLLEGEEEFVIICDVGFDGFFDGDKDENNVGMDCKLIGGKKGSDMFCDVDLDWFCVGWWKRFLWIEMVTIINLVLI